MTNWSQRHQKAEVRDYQLGISGPRRVALFLPGWDETIDDGCLCIARALQLGIINKRTRIIAVERDRSITANIRRRLMKFGFSTPPRFHEDELYNLILAPDERIDYAMFDLLGTLDDDLAQWMQCIMGPHIAPGAVLTFTFSQHWRNCQFMERCQYAWRNDHRALAEMMVHQSGLWDWNLALHLLMLRTIFVDFDFNHRRPQLYRDHVRTMSAFRLENFQRKRHTSPWIDLDTLLARFPRTKRSWV